MEIVIVAPGLPSRGGAGRYTWELSEHFVSKNDHVSIISLYTNRDIYKEKNNLRIIDVADKYSLTQSIKFWINLCKTKKKISRLVNEISPDVVIYMNFPATLWADKFDKVPVLSYPQDINLLYTNTYIKNLSLPKYLLWIIIRIFVRKLDKKRWKEFDEVICNSKYSEKHIISKYDVKSSVIHLGTRTDFFKPTTRKKNVILTFAAQKAQRSHFLLKAVADLIKQRNDFEVWVVGSRGSYDHELKNLVNVLEISNKVKFFGVVSDEKLVDLYSQALITIHLVRQPPFGMIVTESMSCETPVIACHPGGTDETIIHEKTGYLIGENDQENLLKYVQIFLNNPNYSYEMGKEGRKRVEQYFKAETQNEKFRELILDWINKKSKN